MSDFCNNASLSVWGRQTASSKHDKCACIDLVSSLCPATSVLRRAVCCVTLCAPSIPACAPSSELPHFSTPFSTLAVTAPVLNDTPGPSLRLLLGLCCDACRCHCCGRVLAPGGRGAPAVADRPDVVNLSDFRSARFLVCVGRPTVFTKHGKCACIDLVQSLHYQERAAVCCVRPQSLRCAW